MHLTFSKEFATLFYLQERQKYSTIYYAGSALWQVYTKKSTLVSTSAQARTPEKGAQGTLFKFKVQEQCKLHREPWSSAKCTRNTLVKIAVHPAQYLLHLPPKGALGVQ